MSSARLMQLQQEQTRLNNQLNRQNNDLNTHNTRRRNLETAINTLTRTVNSNVSSVNRPLQQASNSLIAGLNHTTQNSQIHAMFENRQEGGIGEDNHLTLAHGAMQQELGHINSQIADTQNAITQTRHQLQANRDAINAEQRRLRDEAMRNLLNR